MHTEKIINNERIELFLPKSQTAGMDCMNYVRDKRDTILADKFQNILLLWRYGNIFLWILGFALSLQVIKKLSDLFDKFSLLLTEFSATFGDYKILYLVIATLVLLLSLPFISNITEKYCKNLIEKYYLKNDLYKEFHGSFYANNQSFCWKYKGEFGEISYNYVWSAVQAVEIVKKKHIVLVLGEYVNFLALPQEAFLDETELHKVYEQLLIWCIGNHKDLSQTSA